LLASEDALRQSFVRARDGRVAGLLRELNERMIGPHTAAQRLLEQLHRKDEP
jgi:hypothetical protein